MRHIVALGTDVVCLQEVEDENCAVVQQALQPLGYTGHFAKKGGGKPDGCATFVRQSTLTWGTVHHLMYSDGAGIERDSGHLALVVVCAYKGRLLGLVNTHLQ
jgi:mRNA deadenylase 3'-5' endonuclease subunit Ccr4